MPDARHMRAKAQQYVDLAKRNGGWEALALQALAAEYISDAEKLEGGETVQSRPPEPSEYARSVKIAKSPNS